MASKKISELTDATLPLNDADLVEVVQGGVNKKAPKSAFGGGGSGTVESVTGDGVDNTDPDNPVIELPNGLAAVDTTGTAIAFAVPQFYGSSGSPETGNVTLVTTGLVKGMVQVLYHNHSSEPTFGSEFKKLSGTYVTGSLNVIYLHAISTSRVEYTISQEL